jgi:hypothetical protein
MKTSNRSDVIQGDEQCRDGHYRAKLDLRTKTVLGMAPLPRWSRIRTTRLPYACKTQLIWANSGHAFEDAVGIPAI